MVRGMAVASRVVEEVEAKLLLPRAADADDLATLRQLGPFVLRPLRRQRLHTTYLDTANLDLARHGLALRLRRDGRRWEVTLKGRGRTDGHLHRRPERNVPLTGTPTFPFVLDDSELRTDLIAIVAGRPLQQLFISDIDRRRFEVRRTDAPVDAPPLAELALDRVHLHSGTPGRSPRDRYIEVEIEQRGGTTDDIEAVAALLAERFTLEPSAETKFARGLAHVLGRVAPGWTDTDLHPDDDIALAARKIVARQLREIRRHDPGTRRGDDPEALHDMRVAVRRLRAARRLLRAGMPASFEASLGEDLRWLGAMLGSVRDLDVQLDRAGRLLQLTPPALRKGFVAFADDLRAQRAQARHALLQSLDSPRYLRLLLRLERFGEARPRRRALGEAALPAAGLAADALSRAYRKLRKRGRALEHEPLPEELHELRIRAKRARYILEFFRDLASKPARRAARRLAKLQDLLGEYNDSVVSAAFVQQYLDGAGIDAAPSTLVTMGAQIGHELERGTRLRGAIRKRWQRFAHGRHSRALEEAIEQLGAVAVESVARRAAAQARRRRTAADAVPVDVRKKDSKP